MALDKTTRNANKSNLSCMFSIVIYSDRDLTWLLD